ncbi:MAG: tetratricopeptide repeat protein [Rhodothermales bacterium]
MSVIRYIVLRALAVLLLAGLAFPGEASAQRRGTSVLDDPDVQREAQRGLDLLYDMQFEQAERIFEQIDREHPKHPIGPFLLALNTWWEILIDLSDTSHDDEFFGEMKEVIKRSDRLLKRDRNNFDAAFFKGAALGFRGRLRSNRGDWFKAAMDGKNAMKYVLRVAEKDPKNDDYVFGKGIYDYYADVIPDRHPFVKPVMIFFPNGDRERGLKLLQRTAEKGRFIQTEAAYFLAQIYYIYERDLVKTSEYIDWLRREHPNNSFFHTLEGRVLARRGRWEEAREVFGEVIARYQKKQTGYNAAAAEQALYYTARADMVYGNYQPALDHLRQLEALAARTNQETYFKVLGRLRQGMAYDALGQRQLAIAKYREVLSMKDWSGAHDRAKQYVERPFQG